MNDQLPRYRSPFRNDDYYYLPISWLHDIKQTSVLDVADMLFYHVDDGSLSVQSHADALSEQGVDPRVGRVYFTERRDDEGAWHRQVVREDRVGRNTLPALFDSKTYKNKILELQGCGKIIPYDTDESDDADESKRNTKPTDSEIIDFSILGWPEVEPVIYRPRSYLDNRWPAWFGPRNWGARATLLACMEILTNTHQSKKPSATKPLVVSISHSELQKRAVSICPAAIPSTNKPLSDGDVQTGIKELVALGLLTEQTSMTKGRGNHYHFDPNIFNKPHCWQSTQIAHYFNLNEPEYSEWTALAASVMQELQQPVTTLKKSWGMLNKERNRKNDSPFLLSGSDFKLFEKFVASQRRERDQRAQPQGLSDSKKNKNTGRGATLTLHLLLPEFKRSKFGKGRYQSDLFTFQANPISLAENKAGQTAHVQMPWDTHHGLNATQLVIHYERKANLSVEEAMGIAQDMYFIITQDTNDGILNTLTIGPCKPTVRDIRFAHILAANHLHKRIDYARPFEVLLRCPNPDPRLQLRCNFVLLR